MKPVKDEPKIIVELRPDQLADIIDAVLAFADDCANDREILQSMPRVDRDTVEDLLQRESALQTLAAWLQHVQEEAEWNYFAPRMRPIPPPCGRNCPDRSGTCRAGCCTWTLYESIRNHIYDVNHRDRDSLQPDLAAGKQMVHADNQIRRRKHIAK